jgi:cytochrome P450
MNTANVVFWLVAHIVSEPELIDIIRTETAPAFRPDGKVDTYYLVNSCPRLASVWHECLRLYASVTTLRYITEDTTLDSKKLKQGNAVLFSARQLAFNEDVFGANYQNFDNMRFFRDPKLQHSNSFRPFGGGKFMCPGRHLSKHVHFAFAAILLRRYDVSCAFPQTMPKPLENEPAIGVLMSPEDFFVNLKPRSEGV